MPDRTPKQKICIIHPMQVQTKFEMKFILCWVQRIKSTPICTKIHHSQDRNMRQCSHCTDIRETNGIYKHYQRSQWARNIWQTWIRSHLAQRWFIKPQNFSKTWWHSDGILFTSSLKLDVILSIIISSKTKKTFWPNFPKCSLALLWLTGVDSVSIWGPRNSVN